MNYSYDEHLHLRGSTRKGIFFVKDSLQTDTQKRLSEALIDYTLCFILPYLPSSLIIFPSLIIWFIFSKKESNLTQLTSKPTSGDRGEGKMHHSSTVLKTCLPFHFLHAVSAPYCLNTKLLDGEHLKKKQKPLPSCATLQSTHRW